MLCPTCSANNDESAGTCSVCGSPLVAAGAAGQALPAGTKLQGGRFTVGKLLGQGGFGLTYLGSEVDLQRQVAIKEYFPEGSRREGSRVQPPGAMSVEDYQSARARFLGEARSAAGLSHPAIVQVYACFEENNTAYMVMEHLKGSSLLQLLEERGRLPEIEAVGYIGQVSNGLAVVHRAGILHRDIKPANIILTAGGRVVLVDFGSAREFIGGQTTRMTMIVTPGYAPLEQYSQRARFGPYSDLYALGATLYHLLTGQVPVQAADRAAGVDLQPPVDYNPVISAEVNEAILWAMEMSIERRPQSVLEFLSLLHTGGMLPALPGPAPGISAAAVSPRMPARLAADASYSVRVSGRDIMWPAECACCGGPASASYSISHTRISPWKRRRQTRSWEVPYCKWCLQHVQYYGAWESAIRSCKTMLFLWDPWAPATAFILIFCLGSGLVPALLAASLMVLAGSVVKLLLWWMEGEADKRKAQAAVLAQKECCSAGPAAACEHWYGSLQTFRFRSRRYATAFRRANVAKLVR